jgi:CBS domain containing-hemolysin-like protein
VIEIVLILLIMVALLLLQGFFSGSEIALVNADKIRMRHLAKKGHRGAQLVLTLFQRPEILLGTTLVGTNISLVASTTLGTLLMMRLFGEYGDLIAIMLYTPLFLIFGEVVPKSVYQQKAEILAPRIIYPLRLFSWIFYPLVFVFSGVARIAVRLTGVKVSHHNLFIPREQVRLILEGSEQAANVDVFDRDRLIRVVRFAGKTVGEVMIPIAEVTLVSYSQSIEEAIAIARKHSYFRFPIYRDEPGQIVGVLTLSIWELMDTKLKERSLTDLCTPALYVVENQPVDELLAELQHRKDHMAIVVDEFGSAIGMITLEELLVEVLGEVVNLGYSFEAHKPRHKGQIDKLGTDRYRMQGRVPLSDVAEVLGISLPYSNIHTLGGLVMSHLRHLPHGEETIVIAGYRFTVESTSEKGINSILVEPA